MGKSASGKDSLYQALLEEKSLNMTAVVGYTTRPIRAGEQNGREYHFVTKEQLEALRQEGKIIEERVYQTVQGPWHYFTADDGQIRLDEKNYLYIGTLESYEKIRDYYGRAQVEPLYIEVEDGLRLSRALQRERKQEKPGYAELCRRFLADCEDFSEENLKQAGITRRYQNEDFKESLEKLIRVITETNTCKR
jgi:guanylate kinase